MMISKDKILHFLSGIIIYVCMFLITSIMALSIIAVVVAGIGKEIYDYYHKDVHTPEVLDAIATILGGATGLILMEVLIWMI